MTMSANEAPRRMTVIGWLDTILRDLKYTIRMLDNSDLQTMEISTPDGSTSALFEVENAESNTVPPKNELIFNKYGNRYFLAKIFDEGNPDGSKVPESQYEKKVSQATQEAQEHVPAYHQEQQGR